MPFYGNLTLRAKYSEDAEHAEPAFEALFRDYELTPDEGRTGTKSVAFSTTTLIPANEFSSISMLVVQNLDPLGGRTIYVTWQDNDAVGGNQNIPAGRIMVLPDVKGSVAVTARAINGSPVQCRLSVMGTKA